MQVDMIRKYIPDIIAQACMFEIVDSLYVSKIKIPLWCIKGLFIRSYKISVWRAEQKCGAWPLHIRTAEGIRCVRYV